jgi:hypothetical protein
MDIRIATMHKRVDIVIQNAEILAEAFFTIDWSSVHPQSYDTWVLSGRSPANRIIADDITAINRTMGARSKVEAWAELTNMSDDIPELAVLDRSWDLFTMSDQAWSAYACRDAICRLLERILGPWRSLSVTTKVLHAKRPRLIPVLDSYVVQVLGGSEASARVGADLIAHLREQGRVNLSTLGAIQERLADAGIQRTAVRIMDALLWSAHPGAWGSKAYRQVKPVVFTVHVGQVPADIAPPSMKH